MKSIAANRRWICLIVALIVAAMAALPACSSQTSSSKGTTPKSSSKSVEDKNVLTGIYENERTWTFEFNADGTCVWSSESASWPGKYKVSGDTVKITVSQMGGSVEQFNFKINGNKLEDMDRHYDYVKVSEGIGEHNGAKRQLSGTYENERTFTFEFDEDGTCVWTDEWASWPGTYEAYGNVVKVTVVQAGNSVKRFDFEIQDDKIVDMEYGNVYRRR